VSEANKKLIRIVREEGMRKGNLGKLYDGLLAPRARWRAETVACAASEEPEGAPAPESPLTGTPEGTGVPGPPCVSGFDG
jgi:hypothetical protein